MDAYLRVGAVAVVALVLAAAAMGAPSATSVSQLHVTLTDRTLVVSPKTFTAGPVTFVVVNKGKLSHALAVFGAGKLKRTATLKPDTTAKLTLDTTSGTYKVWDPVRSSLSHASVLTAKPAPSSAGGTGGTVVGGSTGGALSNNGTKTCLPGQNSDMYDASNATCPPGSTGPGATTTTTTTTTAGG